MRYCRKVSVFSEFCHRLGTKVSVLQTSLHVSVIPDSDKLGRCAPLNSFFYVYCNAYCIFIANQKNIEIHFAFTVQFNILYCASLQVLFGNAKNQTANASVITEGQFSESGEMSCILQNHISSCCITEPKPTVALALMFKLRSCTARKKSVLKTGPKIRECEEMLLLP